MIHTSEIVPVSPAWREATRAERLAQMAATMQQPERAAAELRRASKLLARAAEQMDQSQRERAMAAVREIRNSAVK